jgi:hypothetical protein
MIRKGSSDPQRITRADPALRQKADGIKPSIPTGRVVPMKTFTYWFRPAIFVLLWVILTAFTLAQLATVAPLLRAERPRLRQGWHAVQVSSARR